MPLHLRRLLEAITQAHCKVDQLSVVTTAVICSMKQFSPFMLLSHFHSGCV